MTEAPQGRSLLNCIRFQRLSSTGLAHAMHHATQHRLTSPIDAFLYYAFGASTP